MIRRLLPLVAGAARCPTTRTQPCMQADTCARALAPHDKSRQVHDFSAEPRMPGGACGWFVRVQYAAAAGQASPRVHDAPEGLR